MTADVELLTSADGTGFARCAEQQARKLRAGLLTEPDRETIAEALERLAHALP
ncbi:hypothetical protein [Paraburkholderia sp. CNPSo 3281]|uniref:hypothetical protein n=1 Tax=Paraburkholderia sp. CNPSo 3281 TaxID=2940933 RepID=UPI0020B8D183|nr:hypothetical protein [Paraburkholderia sp. CNPSo 3281]MCP3718957.1 hypothetical protein [Paraburkholderia sp. CNPSo 3281]